LLVIAVLVMVRPRPNLGEAIQLTCFFLVTLVDQIVLVELRSRNISKLKK